MENKTTFHREPPKHAEENVIPMRRNLHQQPHHDTPLQTFCAADLAGKAVPARQWLVEGVIPHRNVTLLSGDGGIGKTLLVLNLFAHIAARADWLSFKTMQGPVLYLGAEDELDEIHRRLDSVRQEMGLEWGEFCDLHYLSLAGEDALLGTFDKAKNAVCATRLYEQVLDRVHSLDAVALRYRHIGRRVWRGRKYPNAGSPVRGPVAGNGTQGKRECDSVVSPFVDGVGERQRHQRLDGME